MKFQHHSETGTEFFRELGRMMQEAGITVAKPDRQPSPAELRKAEEILADTEQSPIADGNFPTCSLPRLNTRSVAQLDVLKQFLARGGEIGGFLKEGSILEPSAAVVTVKGVTESIFFAQALRPIRIIDTRTFFSRSFVENSLGVPSISCEQGALLLFRVNSEIEVARFETFPRERAPHILKWIAGHTTEGEPQCPEHLIAIDPALTERRRSGRVPQLRSSSRETPLTKTEKAIRRYKGIMKAYGVTEEQAIKSIAESAKRVSYSRGGRTWYLNFRSVKESSLQRVLNGHLREGDEIRISFLKAFCQGLRSHNLIHLRETTEIVSREEFKRRFPNTRISDSYLRLSVKQRASRAQARAAAETAKIARAALREARRAEEPQRVDRQAIVESVGAIIHRSFQNGTLIEVVAETLTDLGYINLHGHSKWDVQEVSRVYKPWKVLHASEIERSEADETRSKTQDMNRRHRTPKPRMELVAITVADSIQDVMSELVHRKRAEKLPYGAIEFQGIAHFRDPKNQPFAVGVYRLNVNISFEEPLDNEGRISKTLVPKDTLVLTRKKGRHVSMQSIPSSHSTLFLEKLFPKKSEELGAVSK